MYRSNNVLRSIGAAALLATMAGPAFSFPGKADRARSAITAAQAKIDAADKMNSADETPGLQARAHAALATAKENLAAGNKEDAITNANQASELADTAMGVANRNRSEAAQAANADATQAAADAQQQAAAANARADYAEQSAAAANAQAEALRNQPPVIAPPTTTVTVEKQVGTVPVHKITHRVIHHPARTTTRTIAEKTTVMTTPTE